MFDQWVSLLPERSIQRKVRKIYCRQINQARSKVKTEKKNKKYSRHIGFIAVYVCVLHFVFFFRLSTWRYTTSLSLSTCGSSRLRGGGGVLHNNATRRGETRPKTWQSFSHNLLLLALPACLPARPPSSLCGETGFSPCKQGRGRGPEGKKAEEHGPPGVTRHSPTQNKQQETMRCDARLRLFFFLKLDEKKRRTRQPTKGKSSAREQRGTDSDSGKSRVINREQKQENKEKHDEKRGKRHVVGTPPPPVLYC